MSKKCQLTGQAPVKGRSYTKRGIAKRKKVSVSRLLDGANAAFSRILLKSVSGIQKKIVSSR